MKPDDIYLTISEIKKELEVRNKDEILKKKVADFLGADFPIADFKEPKAVFTRTLMTPNMEMRYFIDLLSEHELSPLFMQYSVGKFVSKNKEKYHLCRPTFFNGINKNKEAITSSINAVDFNENQGKSMNEILIGNNISLPDFHKSLSKLEFPDHFTEENVIDISEWFNKTRFETEYYYLYFLAMFIHHGVLFDNFLLEDPEERKFALDKLMPSIKKIEEMFGVKPLIFPLLPTEHERGLFWYLYPKKLEERIKSMLKLN